MITEKDFDLVILNSLKQDPKFDYFEDQRVSIDCLPVEYSKGLFNSFKKLYESVIEHDFSVALFSRQSGETREVNLDLRDSPDQINEIIQEGEKLSFPYFKPMNTHKISAYKYGCKWTAKRMQSLWPYLHAYFKLIDPVFYESIPFDILKIDYPMNPKQKDKINLKTKDIIDIGFFEEFFYLFRNLYIDSYDAQDKDRLKYFLCHSEKEKIKVTIKEIKKIRKRIKKLGHEELSLYFLEVHEKDNPIYLNDNVTNPAYWIKIFHEEFISELRSVNEINYKPFTELFDDRVSTKILNQINEDINKYKETGEWDIDLAQYSEFIETNPVMNDLFEYCELFVQLERLLIFKEFLEIDESHKYSDYNATGKDLNLSVKKVALIHYYENKQITRENASNIAAEYNFTSKTSGDGLYQDYTWYCQSANRNKIPVNCTPKKLQNQIQLFESIIPHLISEKGISEANSDLEKLKEIYSKEYQ